MIRKALAVLALASALSGCALQRHAQNYNQRTLDKCVAEHPDNKAVCQPLSYPSCQPGAFGQECQ